MKETYKNWGIPLTAITKKIVHAKKERDNKNQKERGPTKPQQKSRWLPIQNKLSTSEPSPENQSKDSNKV